MKVLCKKGFTLVEILVTVLIIGILAALALPQYRRTVEKVKVQEAIINSKYILDEMQRWEYAGQDEGNIELDIGTPHGNPSDPDDSEFCQIASVCLMGEDIHNDTENFIYPIPHCQYGGYYCETWIIERNGNYALLLTNGLSKVKRCVNYRTNIGSYICRYLQSQGWEYAESFAPWGIPDM